MSIKPEIIHQQHNARLDYWWYKENYRRLTSELPVSRVNSARRIITAEQISSFKISGKKSVKATIFNTKKSSEFIIELSFKPLSNETLKSIRDLKLDYHNGIVALINGELPADFYQNFCEQNGEIFLLPEIFSWQCSCPGVAENSGHLCDHVLAILLKLLDECKYMPILYFQLRGFGLPEFKQLYFDLPADDSGRAELPEFLDKDFYEHRQEKAAMPKDWLEEYYGRHTDYSENIAKELEPFREQRYYHHKFNRDFYDTLDALKKEMAKFWLTQN